jgi:hypothetical protein
MAELTPAKRGKLKKGSFAFPGKRAFPIHDRPHATAALRLCGRAKKRFGPNVCKVVQRAVCKRYPDMPICKRGGQ